MDDRHKDQRAEARFRGAWREGALPVLVAVIVALGVAATIDLIDSRQRQPEKRTAKAVASKRAAAVADRTDAPRHVVAVRRSGTAVVVRDATSGAAVGVSVGAPQGRRFHQVAPGGHGSYVVSSYSGGRVAFHRLRLDVAGRPQEITQIPGVLVRGVSTSRSDMAVSATGDRIAYVTYRAGKGRIQIVNVATGDRRSWATSAQGLVTSLSWGGDTLSFVWSPTAKGTPQGQQGQRSPHQVRTLDTTAKGGDLRTSKVALRLPTGSATAVLSGDGKTIVTGVRDASEVSVEAFSALTGRLTKVLWVRKTEGADGLAGLAGLARDSTGAHLLAAGTDGRLFLGSAGSPRGVLELSAADLADVAW